MVSLFKKVTQFFDPCDIDINFSGKEPSTPENSILVEDVYLDPPVKATFPLYTDKEPVVGSVVIRPTKKTLDHKGISIEFYGCFYSAIEVSNNRTTFVSQAIEIPAGHLTASQKIPFSFNILKSYESYRGFHATVSYYVKVTVKGSMKAVTKEREFWVHLLNPVYSEDKAVRSLSPSSYPSPSL